MKINDKLINYKDYITESGSSGNWEWIKYKSGRVEIIGNFQYTGMNCTTQSAGTYYGAGKTENLPFTLSSVKYVGIRETGSRSSGMYVYKSDIYSPYTTLTLEFRAHASTTSGNCGVYVYIIGQVSS